MKTLLAAAILLISANSAMAMEQFACTVNNVTDGLFNHLYLNVDESDVTGSVEIKGETLDIGANPSVVTYEGDHKTMIEIVYRTNLGMDSLSFSLVDVVSKLGDATRFTVIGGAGESSSEQPVSMICDMATPL